LILTKTFAPRTLSRPLWADHSGLLAAALLFWMVRLKTIKNKTPTEKKRGPAEQTKIPNQYINHKFIKSALLLLMVLREIFSHASD
jgi:hypothetical protein